MRVFSEFRNLERAWLCLSKINSNTIGTMRRTAITVNYLQMLCLLVMLSFFLQRVALVVGVLLSSKSLLHLLGCLLAFFKELLYMLCYLLLASSKVYFTCGVTWLVGLLGLLRGDLLSLTFQFL